MTLVKFLMVVLVTIKKDKNVYIILIFQLLLTIIFDVFFVSNLSFSLKLGVNGIAITNIVVNSLLLVVSFLLLYKNKLPLFSSKDYNFSWFKDLFKKGGISGLESLVRNLAFINDSKNG